jgi:hypothetical protein
MLTIIALCLIGVATVMGLAPYGTCFCAHMYNTVLLLMFPCTHLLSWCSCACMHYQEALLFPCTHNIILSCSTATCFCARMHFHEVLVFPCTHVLSCSTAAYYITAQYCSKGFSAHRYYHAVQIQMFQCTHVLSIMWNRYIIVQTCIITPNVSVQHMHYFAVLHWMFPCTHGYTTRIQVCGRAESAIPIP